MKKELILNESVLATAFLEAATLKQINTSGLEIVKSDNIEVWADASEEENGMTREEFGYKRLSCDCPECRCFCRYMPGNLIPSDLDRLIPAGADPYQWAEEHLTASYSGRLVTRMTERGCHWLTADGLCSVHEQAPFGCAFFSCPKVQRSEDAQDLTVHSYLAAKEAHETDSLYGRLWRHLWDKGHRRTQADADEAIRKVDYWIGRLRKKSA